MTSQANFTFRGRNPDVLTCIANLSNDEIFTPPELANQILDMLAQAWALNHNGADIWADKTVKFLDPCTKSGVFLREITSRLTKGLENEIPDLEQRVNHILTQQVFGIGITQITSLLARRSLYCSKYALSEHSIAREFASNDGNIWFQRVNHKWDGDKCKYCGAGKSSFDRATELENHAYAFIHTNDIKNRIAEIFGDNNMQFDVIIGNPPYQLEVGVEKDNYAIALYHHFVRQAKNLGPRYLTMIIPSRWFAGGRGLDDFRDEMLNDDRLRVIHDYPEAIDCFPGTQIKGGVCYFLWNRDERGLCSVTTYLNGKKSATIERPLIEQGLDTFIRFNESISILRKVALRNEPTMQQIISPQTPFGLVTSFKGKNQRSNEFSIKMLRSGGHGWVSRGELTRGEEYISQYKVFIPKAGSGSDKFPHTILGKPIVGKPGTVCNQTYLVLGPFGSEAESLNAASYIRTRFLRFMVLLKKNTQDAMRDKYALAPIQDFTKTWSDQELYKKYGLSNDEIAFIESMIRPMDFEEASVDE